MKLLAPFYAYLALILFMAVLSIDCRATAARDRHVEEEEPEVPQELEEPPEHKMLRRNAFMDVEDEPQVPEEFEELTKHAKQRRQAPPDMPFPGRDELSRFPIPQ